MGVVDTTSGPVLGAVVRERDRRAVDVFRGIPFARPPVGALRFAAPEAPDPWREPRDASRFGPSAPQRPTNVLNGLVPGMTVGETSEDCLTLNVWTPAVNAGARRPVLVWLHGGAFQLGGSSLATYDGMRLAADGDVVVVSCNYRLGALGFCALDAPNCGLLDQIAALRWVRDNIAAFGGDPSRVTIFGESAGGGCVLHLLAAPAARGLFQRAIAQSGATDFTLTPQRAAEVAARFAECLGAGPGDLDALRAVPVERILAAQDEAAAALLPSVGLMPFHPVADGAVVTASPDVAIARGSADGVDLVIGITADEMRLFLDPSTFPADRVTLARHVTRLRDEVDVDAVVDTYTRTARPHRASPADLWSDMTTDVQMSLPARRVADGHARRGNRTYGYVFTWPAAAHDGALRACHAVDLPFTFGTFDREGWHAFVGGGTEAEALSTRMRAAWCAFARDGEPGWARYEPPVRTTMLLGRECRTVDDPGGERLDSWSG